ncbi:predicted protein [Naegleria gruberi]|uniref:Predicted protein n=1 Tax=Naegleria gruberi TaxID=5762 RepID=D2W1E5_NAEGR|nr:uncharacterized protein NAEGRDRAFT_75188 [Naegleria gruberi]EFC37034.1 predicted protein [Naegleria gruberi]|eukprot:XP_002669778.1 predicted protein [Naegleria gruberi strain NEG-M]
MQSFLFSKTTKIENRLNSLTDLQNYHGKIKTFIRSEVDKNLITFQKSQNCITKLLQCYEFDSKPFIDEELFSINPKDDRKLTCMKIMILIFHFDMMTKCERMIRTFDPFYCFIEDEAIPQVFDCVKRITSFENDPNLQSPVWFDTELSSLERWQQFILHLLIRMQVDVLKCYTNINCLKHKSSYFVLVIAIILLKYFYEKKRKFLKWNSGELWEQSKADCKLLNCLIDYWYLFILLKKNSPRFNIIVEVYGYVITCCLYSFAEVNEEREIDKHSHRVIQTLSNSYYFLPEVYWKTYVALLVSDCRCYQHLNDNITIISDTDFGKNVWVIKYKLLACICSLSELRFMLNDLSLCDRARHFISLYQLELRMKDFIIESLKREGETKYTQWKFGSIDTSLAVASIDYLNYVVDIGEHEEFIRSVLNLWKGYLFSNKGFRIWINNTIAGFLVSNECPDDLLEEIIRAHQINLIENKSYIAILKGVVKTLNRENCNQTLLESFKELVIYLFDFYIENESMDYLQTLNVSNEDLVKIHQQNVINCFKLVGSSFQIIMDCGKLETILSEIKKRTEIMWDNNIFNHKMIFSFIGILEEIIKYVDFDNLMDVFNKLNYNSFIIRLIHSIIFQHERCDDIKQSHRRTFIVFLIDNPILGNELLHDHISPFIINQSMLALEYLTNLQTIKKDDVNIETFEYNIWALRRMVQSVVTNGSNHIDLHHLLDCHLSKFIPIMERIQTLKGEKIENLSETILSTCLIIGQSRMNIIAPQLLKFIHLICEISFSLSMENDEDILILTCILNLIEYLIDNEMLKIEIGWLEEWINDEHLVALIRHCTTFHKILYRRIHCKILISQ